MTKKVDFKGSVILNPVPVVLITSRNKEGKENIFTVAWTGTVCTKPPMLSISVRPERLSYEYIKETMEFISIECKVKSIIPLGTHDLFIADVVGSHVDASLMDDKGKIHFEEADLITYCHGEYYKMDKYPLGKFGYSVAKKPVEIKNSTLLKEKTTEKDSTKQNNFSKSKNKAKNKSSKSVVSSKKRNTSKNNSKFKKKTTNSNKQKIK